MTTNLPRVQSRWHFQTCKEPARAATAPGLLPALLRADFELSYRASRRSCDPAQRRKHATCEHRLGIHPSETKIQFPIDLVELLVCARSDEVGFSDAITRTDRVFRFFRGAKGASAHEREDDHPQSQYLHFRIQ